MIINRSFKKYMDYTKFICKRFAVNIDEKAHL